LNESPLIPRTRTLVPGSLIDGRYEVISLVAEGGMGFIYKAKQHPLERIVALKVLRKELAHDESSIKRFTREAKTISQLSHPDIITLFDYGVDPGGQMYLVVEWLDGADLADILGSEGRIDPLRASRIAMITARSLAAAHRKGVIHRDLKPENIFLLQRYDEAEEERVKVLDFGIAKLLNEEEGEVQITRMGAVCGTPEFMSPEQARGEQLDGRSDIYALGCLLYAMLVGALPFEHESVYQLLLMHQRHQMPSLPDGYPRELNDVIQRATRKNRDERYATADEMADALEAFFRRETELARLLSEAPPDEDFSDTQVIGNMPHLQEIFSAADAAKSGSKVPATSAAQTKPPAQDATHILTALNASIPVKSMPDAPSAQGDPTPTVRMESPLPLPPTTTKPPRSPKPSAAPDSKETPTVQANFRSLVKAAGAVPPPAPPQGLLLTPKVLAASVAVMVVVVALMMFWFFR
jgi:serine/threonine protein kinase